MNKIPLLMTASVSTRGMKNACFSDEEREAHFGGLEGSNVNALSFSKQQDSLKGKIKRIMGNFIRIFFPFFKF